MRGARVVAIGLQGPGIAVVVEIGHQAFIDDALAHLLVLHGPGQFHTAQHVAVHPVGARQVQVFLVAGSEIEHPRVLQKTTDHRAHPNALRHAGHLRRQHARAAHDQVDARPVLRRLQQGLNQRFIGERIHLRDDARVLAAQGGLPHGLGHLDHALLQVEGCQQHVVQMRHTVLVGEVIEHRIHVGRDLGIGGQHAQIGIELGGTWVVVTGREMAVAAQLTALAARHQQHLGVCLEADHAIDHLRADRLQRLGPIDVGLFVKARLELHDRGHFLAAPHRFAQQVHHFRVRAGAVNRLLDDQHLGVVYGLAQEREHAVETLEGLVNEHIALFQLGKDRGGARQLLGPGRLPVGEQQRAIRHQLHHLRQPHQIHRSLHAVQRGRRQAELHLQKFSQITRAARRDFQAHRLTVVAVLQALAQGHAQVAHIFFIHGQIGMPRHAELRELRHLAPRKQIGQMRADDAGERHQLHALRRDVERQANHARQDARDLDDRDFVLPAEGIAALQTDNEVERFVRHLREWVRRIEAHGDQQRPHVALKILAHPALLRAGAFAVRDHANPVRFKRGSQRVVVQLVLARHQLVGLLGQGLERRHAVFALGLALLRGRQMRGRTDLEKLVQIRGNDAQIAQALQ